MPLDILLDQWSRLYDLADQILRLKPWEDFFEAQLFTIQPAPTGPTYFVSVMGHRGEYHALAFYKDAEGLGRFREAQSEDTPEESKMEAMLLNPHMQLSFEPSRGVHPKDRVILKALQRQYRGKWPLFRSHQPARVPWYISKPEADTMELLLEQALIGLKRVQRCPDLLRDCAEPAFFSRRRTPDGTWEEALCEVADLPVPQRILRANLPANALAGLPRYTIQLEAELSLMLAPINSGAPGQAPYFPYLLMLVDAESGRIVGIEIVSTADGPDAALVQLPDALTKILHSAKMVPSKIAARHPVLLSALKTYGEVYKIDCQLDPVLPMASMAMQSLQASMRG